MGRGVGSMRVVDPEKEDTHQEGLLVANRVQIEKQNKIA